MIKPNPFLAPFAMLALASTSVPVQAQAPQVSLEQRMLLRCSATFALVADAQSRGDESVSAWPDMSARGQDFFIRASARVMDESALDREAIAALLRTEAQDIAQTGAIEDMMRVCLPMLPNVDGQ